MVFPVPNKVTVKDPSPVKVSVMTLSARVGVGLWDQTNPLTVDVSFPSEETVPVASAEVAIGVKIESEVTTGRLYPLTVSGLLAWR